MKKATALLGAGVLCLLGVAVHASPAIKAARAPDFAGCRKVPGGKPILKLNLRPDSKLPDLINYISTISCTPFLVPAGVDVDKTFTLEKANGRLMSVEEMYDLFISVLNSKGLTVESAERVLRIVPSRGSR